MIKVPYGVQTSSPMGVINMYCKHLMTVNKQKTWRLKSKNRKIFFDAVSFEPAERRNNLP